MFLNFYLWNHKVRQLTVSFQSVLNDLVRELLPVLHEHLKYYAVDITTVTFNWFVTIFIDAVPFEVRGEMKRSINSVR